MFILMMNGYEMRWKQTIACNIKSNAWILPRITYAWSLLLSFRFICIFPSLSSAFLINQTMYWIF